MAEENEQRARRMGWVPEDEFKGDPEKWVDADTFVQRGEEIMPVLKENLGRMETKFESLQGEYRNSQEKIEQLNKTLERVVDMSKTASKRAYQRALRDLKKQQREAAKNGDLDTYDAIDRQMEELGEESVKEEPKREAKSAEGGIHPDFGGWHKENLWYGQDKELTAFANGLGPIVAQEIPGVDGKPFFDEVTRRVKAAFPQKFENPMKKKADVVEGGGGEGESGGGKKKTYRDLPQEAKEACDEFVSQGLFKDRQAYVDEYFVEEA